jgi:hypothetical protein
MCRSRTWPDQKANGVADASGEGRIQDDNTAGELTTLAAALATKDDSIAYTVQLIVIP